MTGPDHPPRLARCWGALRRTDWGRLTEWLVLAGVLAIAALISYTHLREVWRIVGAPWAGIGPLTIDGLFAAAWLRMRRRRRQDQAVGRLVLTTLFGALVVTVAGNVAAAFPAWVAEQRDYVAPVVYAWAAIAFAFVFELVTGHDRHPAGPPAQQIEARTSPDQSGQSEPVQTQPEPPLADEYFAAVQALANELGAQPTRQAVRDLTGVGATRADRLRSAVRVPDLSEQDKRAAERPTNGSSHG